MISQKWFFQNDHIEFYSKTKSKRGEKQLVFIHIVFSFLKYYNLFMFIKIIKELLYKPIVIVKSILSENRVYNLFMDYY